mmetsp:Transcript_15083/g.19399  ORF Transcript_15083/g.19399 Transcript_15083/m.19399 type:complete len:108 (-) Transcript_15083:175-498(-)|eukprot:CAMPEP_0184448302 /NCGR_PEP_ID=MMETSP0740-20130409/4306_1 /TAXON_ID=385413 /ORGANISM="Thalassiosira miniscula, Strain CCMP1093" /LENGTH=107 /DNA_ID=CAMNT_0026818181 /DNA_START=47 /DNA_END=370 /DNA_ORIENTATION=+
MKLLSLLSILPCTAFGFQHVAPKVHYNMVDRAEQCAAFIDFCDVAELKMLADELEEFQAVTQPQDKAKKVCNILRKQSELKRMMENFAMDVEPNTNDVFDDYMYYHW